MKLNIVLYVTVLTMLAIIFSSCGGQSTTTEYIPEVIEQETEDLEPTPNQALVERETEETEPEEELPEENIYELDDISIWYPEHWQTEREELADGYSVEFFDANNRDFNFVKINVEEDVFGLTAQEWVYLNINPEDRPTVEYIDYGVIEVDGVESARIDSWVTEYPHGWFGAHEETDIRVTYILIPHNNMLYTFSFLFDLADEGSAELIDEMIGSIVIS